MVLRVLKHVVGEWVRTRRMARSVGRGSAAEAQLRDFETAQPLCGDRLRVGSQHVFTRKGGVIPYVEIYRACLRRKEKKQNIYVIYLVEDAAGRQRLLARWPEKEFREEYVTEISHALAERCGHMSFDSFSQE